MPANAFLITWFVCPKLQKNGNNSLCLCRLERVHWCKVTVQKPRGPFEDAVRGCQRAVLQRILRWYETGSLKKMCLCACVCVFAFLQSYIGCITLILFHTFKGMFPEPLEHSFACTVNILDRKMSHPIWFSSSLHRDLQVPEPQQAFVCVSRHQTVIPVSHQVRPSPAEVSSPSPAWPTVPEALWGTIRLNVMWSS